MSHLDSPENFAQCLVRLRDQRKIPQKSLALTADMDQSYLAGLESGRRSPPRERQVLRLLTALNATEDEASQLFSARAITKLNMLINKAGPKETVPLARLLVTAAGMCMRDVNTLEQIASVLISAGQRMDAGGTDM